MMTIFDIGGDGLHRAGPVERDNGDQILQAFGLETHQDVAHPCRFKLENAFRLPTGKHFIDLLVLRGNLIDIEIRLAQADHFLRIVDYR